MKGNPFRRHAYGPSPEQFDLVFVVAEQNRGWILEAICKEVASRMDGTHALVYANDPLPRGRAYCFSHYLLFLDRRDDPLVRRGQSLVLFTHPSYRPEHARRVVRQLRSATCIVSLSTIMGDELVRAGLPPKQLAIIVPGADPTRFRSHRRGRGVIGFCSAYYERKRPELIVDLVRLLPERRFRLLGRGWEGTIAHKHLEALPNFEYLESDYDAYPDFYDSLDVLVSPSRLEGGPIPLLEAMMSNVVPVASRTGFGPDLIEHGVNGFLCDVAAPADEYARCIEAAGAISLDIRATVERYTWDAFAQEVLALALG